MSETPVPFRVRSAPSPTGKLQLGNVRTFLFDWLLAKHTGGQYVMRIEDTDRNRLVPGALEAILETHKWLGIEPDEGPEVGGPYGPYIQSERLEHYTRYAEKLISEEKAYRCYCSEERLADLRAQQQREGRPTGYDRHCRYLNSEEREHLESSGEPSVVRFAAPLEGSTTLVDALRGPVTYQNSTVEDFVILKTDGYPPYHFAVVIDDHLMEITHVLRGEEYISSGAKDILLHEALGWAPPVYVHVSIVLGPDRTRLSKRHGAVPALEYRDMGFVPEALFNFLCLLGAAYSGDREIYSREELIELFDIDKMSPSPAVLDRTKLEWMNAFYINHILTLQRVTDLCTPVLKAAGLISEDTPRPYLEQVVELVKDRIKLIPDVVELTDFFFKEPTPVPAEIAGKKLTTEEATRAIENAHKRLDALTKWEDSALEEAMRSLAAEMDMKAGALFMPLRVALTGRTVSPGLFETMCVLGRNTTLARLDKALVALSQT